MSDADVTPRQVLLLECNVDDMSGEALAYALERLLEAGALDAWFTPIYAKKNRPAVLLSVLCRLQDGASITERLLTETTTLGVRTRQVDRVICERQSLTTQTPWGAVRCKVKLLAGRALSVKPEYEDCARLARLHDVRLEAVIDQARRLAWEQLAQSNTP